MSPAQTCWEAAPRLPAILALQLLVCVPQAPLLATEHLGYAHSAVHHLSATALQLPDEPIGPRSVLHSWKAAPWAHALLRPVFELQPTPQQALSWQSLSLCCSPVHSATQHATWHGACLCAALSLRQHSWTQSLWCRPNLCRAPQLLSSVQGAPAGDVAFRLCGVGGPTSPRGVVTPPTPTPTASTARRSMAATSPTTNTSASTWDGATGQHDTPMLPGRTAPVLLAGAMVLPRTTICITLQQLLGSMCCRGAPAGDSPTQAPT